MPLPLAIPTHLRGSAAIAYTVTMTLPRGAAFDAWVAWLDGVHLADVCAAGAEEAELVVLDIEDVAVACAEARYRFASREAFAAYEQNHAPRLRAEGLATLATLRLAPSDVTFQRTTGELRTRRA